jgi:hypothetical protein
MAGIFEERDCEIAAQRLSPGRHAGALHQWRDGIVQGCARRFGEQRHIDALRQNCEVATKALIACIVDEAREFSPHEQHDDITVIVAKCKAGATA